MCSYGFVVVVQSPSCVWLFATPWTAARQAFLPLIISQSLSKFMSIESMMPSNHLILCPLLLPSICPTIRVFSKESADCIRWQVLELQHQSFQNIQGWFPLTLTGLISVLSKGLSSIFSKIQLKKNIFQLHLDYNPRSQAQSASDFMPSTFNHANFVSPTKLGLASLQPQWTFFCFRNTPSSLALMG